jgi:hypothetical protein
MTEIALNRVLSEELESDADLGTEQDSVDFAAQIGDQPIGLRLRSVFEQLEKPVPPALALYRMFEVWLIPHRFSLIRRKGLAEPTSIGLEIQYEHDDTTCSVVSLIPTPIMRRYGQVSVGFNFTGSVSTTGEFAPTLEGTLNPVLNVGSLGFGVKADGGVGFEYSATVALPVVSAVGIGGSRCEWRLDRQEEPLFGRTIETWAAVVLPKRQKELKYRLKFYYLIRTLFFPTRRESDYISVTCKLVAK